MNSRKARLGAFRSAGVRVPLEDVVTSTVFGPLEFMCDDDRHRSIDLVCEALTIESPDRRGPLRVSFWPRLPISEAALRARYSEPDLVFVDAEGPLAVIEVKWGAPLSQHELAAQWAALGGTARRRAVHLLLVQEPGGYRAAVALDRELVEAGGLGPWNLLVRSWRLLAGLERLSQRMETSQPVRAWASGVTAFLRREHPATMHGWDGIGLTTVDGLDWAFRKQWLTGLLAIPTGGGWWTDG